MLQHIHYYIYIRVCIQKMKIVTFNFKKVLTLVKKKKKPKKICLY